MSEAMKKMDPKGGETDEEVPATEDRTLLLRLA
jgi:hypothetical protein